MSKFNHSLLCVLAPVAIMACDSGSVSRDRLGSQVIEIGSAGEESAETDSANLDIGGSDLVYAPFCQEEPFASATTGTFNGLIAHELFSEFSRCEFEVSLTIEQAGADNQFCEQTGTLSFTGAQTVSTDISSICASVEDTLVTIGWDLQEYSEPTADGAQVELVSELTYPLHAVVNSWDIDSLPELTEEGTQIEYPVILFSLQLNEDLTISGGDSELYSGVLQKVE